MEGIKFDIIGNEDPFVKSANAMLNQIKAIASQVEKAGGDMGKAFENAFAGGKLSSFWDKFADNIIEKFQLTEKSAIEAKTKIVDSFKQISESEDDVSLKASKMMASLQSVVSEYKRKDIADLGGSANLEDMRIASEILQDILSDSEASLNEIIQLFEEFNNKDFFSKMKDSDFLKNLTENTKVYADSLDRALSVASAALENQKAYVSALQDEYDRLNEQLKNPEGVENAEQLAEEFANTEVQLNLAKSSVIELEEVVDRLTSRKDGFDGMPEKVSKVTEKIDEAKRAVDDYGSESEEAKKATDELKHSFEDANKAFEDYANKTNEGSAKIVGSLKQIAAMAGIAFGLNELGGFVKQVASTREYFQDIESSMNVFLGSEEKSMEFTQKLKDYAWYNMFDFEQLAKASQQMIAYGQDVDTIIDKLDMLSNVASGTHAPLMEMVDAYNRAKSTGVVDANGMKSWATKGVVIKDILKDMGQAASSTSVTFEQLNMVLEHITGEGGMFHNLMAEQLNNISAEKGQLEDNLSEMFNSIGEKYQEVITDWYKLESKLVKNWEKVGGDAIETFGEGMRKAIGWLTENWQTLLTVVKSAVVIYGSWRVALAVLTPIQNLHLKLTQAQATADRMASAGKTKLTASTVMLNNAWKSLNKTMLASPYTWIAVAITGVIYSVYKFREATLTAEKAERMLTKAADDYIDAIKEQNDVDKENIKIIQSKTASLMAQKKAYNELKASSGVFSQYSQEEIRGMSSDQIERLQEQDKNQKIDDYYKNQIEALTKFKKEYEKAGLAFAYKEFDKLKELAKQYDLGEEWAKDIDEQIHGLTRLSDFANESLNKAIEEYKKHLIEASESGVVSGFESAFTSPEVKNNLLQTLGAFGDELEKLNEEKQKVEQRIAEARKNRDEAENDTERLRNVKLIESLQFRLRALEKEVEESQKTELEKYKTALLPQLEAAKERFEALNREYAKADEPKKIKIEPQIINAYNEMNTISSMLKLVEAGDVETTIKIRQEVELQELGDEKIIEIGEKYDEIDGIVSNVMERLEEANKSFEKAGDTGSASADELMKSYRLMSGDIEKDFSSVRSSIVKDIEDLENELTKLSETDEKYGKIKIEIQEKEKLRDYLDELKTTLSNMTKTKFGITIDLKAVISDKVKGILKTLMPEDMYKKLFGNEEKKEETNYFTKIFEAAKKRAHDAAEAAKNAKTYRQQVKYLNDQIVKEKKKLKELEKSDKKDNGEGVKAQREVINRLESDLKKLTGGGSKGNKNLSKQESDRRAKEIQQEQKHAEEMVKLERESRRAQEDAAVEGIKDQGERERAERALQHKRALEDLKIQREDIYKQIYEQRKQAYETAHKNDKGGAHYELTEEGAAGWRGLMNRSVEAVQEAEKQMLRELGKGEIMDALQEQFGKGNVDVLARPMIEAAELVKKGWKDAGDGIATVFSSQYGIKDSEGNVREILVTPILPDGRVLSEKELEDYIYNTLEGASDILKADTKGIVISLGEVGFSGDLGGEALHQLHEQLTDLPTDKLKEIQKMYENIGKVRPFDTEEAKQYQLVMDALNAKTIIETEKRQREIEKEKDERIQALRDYIKEYGSIQDKRAAITGEYDKKISETNDAVLKATLEKQKENLLSQLDMEEIKGSLDWEAVFNDLQRQSSASLKKLKEKLRQALDAKDITAENAKTLAEKILEIENTLSRRKNPVEAWLPGLRERKRLTDQVLETEMKIDALRKVNEKNEAKVTSIRGSIATTISSQTGSSVEEVLANWSDLGSDDMMKVLGFFGIGEASKELVDKFTVLKTSTTDLSESQENFTTAQKELMTRKEALNNFMQGGDIAQYFKDITSGMDFGGIAQLINTNVQSMSKLVDQIGLGSTDFGEAVHNFADGVGGFNSAIQSLASGDIFGAVSGIVEGFQGFGKLFGIGGGNAKEVNKSINRLTEQNAILSQSIDKLTAEIGNSAGNKALSSYKRAVELQQKMESNLQKQLQLQMSYNEAHHSFNYYWKPSKELISSFNAISSLNWSGDLGSIDANTAKAIMENAELVQKIKETGKGGYGERVLEWVSALAEQAGTIDDLTKQINENLTRMSFDDMRSSFLSTLMDMEADTKDFANDITKTMAEALVNRFVLDDEYDKWLEGWLDRYSKVMQDNTLNQEQRAKKLQALKDEAKQEVESLGKEAQGVLDAIGYNDIIDLEKAKEKIDSLCDAFRDAFGDIEMDAKSFTKKINAILTEDLLQKRLYEMPIEVSVRSNIQATKFNEELVGTEKILKQSMQSSVTYRKRTFDSFEDYFKDWYERYQKALAEGNNELIQELLDEFTNTRQTLLDNSKDLIDVLKDITDDTFSSMTDSFVSSLMDMNATADDMGQEIGETLSRRIIEKFIVSQQIQPLLDEIQAAYDNAVKNGGTLEDVLGDEAIKNAIQALKDRYPEIKEQVQSILDLFGVKGKEEISTSFGDLHDTFMDAITDMENGLDKLKKKLNETLIKDLIEKKVFDAEINIKIGGEDKTFNNFDEYQEGWLKRYDKVYNDTTLGEEERNNALQALVDEMVAQEQIMATAAEDLAKRIQEEKLDTTFTDMQSNFVSALMDMEGDVENFANDIKKTIVQKMVEAFMVSEKIKPYLDDLQKTFNYAVGLKDATDAERAEILKGGYTEILEDGTEAVHQGIDSVTSVLGPLKNTVKAMLEEIGYEFKDTAEDFTSTLNSALMDGTVKAEDFAKTIKNSIVESLVASYTATEEFQAGLKAVTQSLKEAVESGDEEKIKEAQKNVADFYDVATKGVERYTKALEKAEEETDETFMNMSGELMSALTDAEKTFENWSQTLGQKIAEKIFEGMIAKSSILKNVQNVFNKVLGESTDKDSGYIDWANVLENEELRQAVADGEYEFNVLKDEWKALMQVFGIKLPEPELPFSDLADTLTDALTDAEYKVEDFGKQIASKLMNELLSEMMNETYAERIKEIREMYQHVLAGDEGYTWDMVRDKIVEFETELQNLEDSNPIKQLSNDIKELGKVSDETFSSMSESLVSTLTNMEATAEDLGRDIGKTLVEKIVREFIVTKELQQYLNNIQSAYDDALSFGLDGEDIIDYVMPYIDAAVDAVEGLKPFTDKLVERFTKTEKTTSFGDLRDAFMNALYDMENGAEDFKQTLRDTLSRDIVQKQVFDVPVTVTINNKEELFDNFDKYQKWWTDEYSRIYNSNEYTAEERERLLQQMVDELVRQEEIMAGKAKDIVERYRKTVGDTTFKDMGDSLLSALTDVGTKASDIGRDIGRTLVNKLVKELVIGAELQDYLNDIQTAYDEAMSQGMSINEAIDYVTPKIDAAVEATKQWEPVIEEISERFTELSTPIDDLRSTFRSSLMDMSSDTKSFAQDISRTITEAFLDAFVLADFDDRLEAWKERYSKIMKNGDLSEEERAREMRKLQDEIIAAKEGYVKNARDIQDLLGYGEYQDQNATVNMADKATYDQFEQYLGIAVSTQITGEQQLMVQREILSHLSALKEMMNPNNSALLTQAAIANDHLRLIKEASQAIQRNLSEHLASMDSKLTTLRKL